MRLCKRCGIEADLCNCALETASCWVLALGLAMTAAVFAWGLWGG